MSASNASLVNSESPLVSDVEISTQERPRSRAERLARVLASNTCHKSIILLIAVDACIVLVDLSYNFLLRSCVPDNEDNPLWLEILSHISLAITSLFVIEIPLNLFAFGSSFYNPFGTVPHARLHLLDASVIVGSFVIDVFLRGRERELASLLVLLRLWRLVKLVGGVAVGVGELNEEVEKRCAVAEAALAKKNQELNAANAQISNLQARIAELEASSPLHQS